MLANPTYAYWETSAKTVSLQTMLDFLGKTAEGRRILRVARERNAQFIDDLAWGKASLTESTLRRSFDVSQDKEWVESQHKVFIRRDQSIADALLDLAHELTHYGLREAPNPYELDFALESFVRTGIEGKGGELDAFVGECAVAREYRAMDRRFPAHPLCDRYKDTVLRDRARLDFYRVGAKSYGLEGVFPEVETSSVVFRSAYAGQAYPVALANEFKQLREDACRNNQKRLDLIRTYASANQRENRSPSQMSPFEQRIIEFQQIHCIN